MKKVKAIAILFAVAAGMFAAGGGTAEADCLNGSTCFHCVCPCEGCR
jgi:hypothetical protein